jgi:hypothetical protein
LSANLLVRHRQGVAIDDSFYSRMKMYTESVGKFNAVVKDLPFRNGHFYTVSKDALAKGLPDPCPLHTKLLRKVSCCSHFV